MNTETKTTHSDNEPKTTVSRHTASDEREKTARHPVFFGAGVRGRPAAQVDTNKHLPFLRLGQDTTHAEEGNQVPMIYENM